MTTQKELQREYDRIVEQTLRKLKKTKPLTKQKLAKALFDANKAYWTSRLFIIDNSAVNEAENVAIALAAPYANAAQTFSDRVRNIYAGYESAFSLTHKDAKELLDKVVYDRTIAENLKTVAEGLTDEEEKQRILAEISAPAYRYRLQRAEKLTEQAQSVCDAIAKREVRTDRAFLQTQTEKAYNITIDDVKPSDTILESIEPIQLRFNEMPKASEPVQDFTPTTDKGVLDSFSLVPESNVREIVNTDWSGHEFSERIWNNTGELANEVKQVLIEGELTGASEADMAAKIAERFQVGMHKARRVVRTEQNYCINQAEMKGLKDAGYDSYEYCSLHEERDCDICDALDGKVFKFADAAVGINMPPIHPFCRCRITAPEETLEDLERELDEMIDSWNIPEGMSLDEFVERVNNGELEEIRAEQNSTQESVEKNIDYMSKSFRPDYSQETKDLIIDDIPIPVKSVENSRFIIVTDIDATRRDKAVRLVEKQLEAIEAKIPEGFQIPKIAVVDFDKHGLNTSAIAGYHKGSDTIYFNSRYNTREKIIDFVMGTKDQFANKTEFAPILHELGHKEYEKCVKTLAKSENMSYNKAKEIIDDRIYTHIHRNNNDGSYLRNNVSKYADIGFLEHHYSEIAAECFSVYNENQNAHDIIDVMRGVDL